MTEKRFILKYLPYETDNGEIIEGDPYYIDKEEEYIDEEDYYTVGGYPVMSDKQVVDLLNKLSEENKELREDNDIKFWKLQCMHYFNSNSLFMSEISRAIKKGYEVSDKFQEYLDELKENNKEIKEKNERLFGDSE